MTALDSKLSPELLNLGANIITNAAETGAIGYWIGAVTAYHRNADRNIDTITFTAPGVEDDSQEVSYTVTPADIIQAMQKVKAGEVRINSEMAGRITADLGYEEYTNGDALTDDALVQIAAFGRIIFG